MEDIVAEINSLPHHRSVRNLEHPLVSIHHGITIDFMSNTSRTARISEPPKFRKSSKYLQVSGKYLQVLAGFHTQTPAGDIRPPSCLWCTRSFISYHTWRIGSTTPREPDREPTEPWLNPCSEPCLYPSRRPGHYNLAWTPPHLFAASPECE